MAITLLEATSAGAVPATKTVDAPNKAIATQAADIPSARVAARLSGKRVEALSERTETSTTWVNKDGSLTSEFAAGPIRFERDGKWVDVDVDLRESGSGVEPVAHPEGLRLAGRTGTPAKSLKAAREARATDLATLGEGNQQITLQWKGGLPQPKLDGARAEYVNAVPGADVVVEATRTGFEQFVEVKQRPDTDGYSYTLPLKAKGLKAKQLADGSILFTDRKNKKRAVMPAPVMWDATVDKRSGEHTNRTKVGLKVVRKGSTVDLVVTPDAKFLADPDTQYPVTVDPSTSSLGNVFDTYVQQGETVDWSTDTELDLGNPGTTNSDGTPRTARSFISWNTTPIQDALVLDAKLSLWNFHSGNNTDCALYPWEVWSTGAASTSVRWTAQPAWTAKKATSTETRGNAACTAQPDGWINADVTTLVQEWASAKATRGHMGLRAASETVAAQWKRVNSANAASNPPKLVVNYNYRPRTGTKQEAGPPYFSYSGAYTVNTTTPTLRDTFVDADGDKVNGTFQIYDNATSTQVGDVIVSKYVPSGQVASMTVPSGVLTNGKTYKFRTSPYDGAHYNAGWSAWKTFTVDTAAPSAPTAITSTDYPSNAWVKGAGQAGTFNVTPPSADNHWLEWSLDGVTWNKVATSGASGAKAISIDPPKDGTHTLQVRSADKADNKSEAIEYTFHAGPGGFVQPSAGERTARRLPLVAEADGSKYDNVSFSWRRSAADAWARIPAGDVTSDGNPLTAWPVPLASGKNSALVWNATDTVDPDGTVQIKADFTGSGGNGSTEPLTVVVDRNAEGAATEEVGPGTLNLLTGDYSLQVNDVSAAGLAVNRTSSSRQPSRGAQEGQVAIFGKEWTEGVTDQVTTSDYSHLRKVSDTAVAVVTSDGTRIHFTANAAKNGWLPEPGAEGLTLEGSVSAAFTLSDTAGTKTAFAKPDAAATTWQATTTLKAGAAGTTTVVSETVTVDGNKLARPKMVIAPTSAGSATTCAATPSAKGCRVVEYVYSTTTSATALVFGDTAGQVKEIRLWSTEPGAASGTSRSVQTYHYDDTGRLRESWNPQISQAVKSQYEYDSAGRVTKLTTLGELPWAFTYGKAGTGSAAGEGMLLKASRPGLKAGTTGTEEGTAATSVVYDVATAGATAPYKMAAADVKAWGQIAAPTDATAVFPADSVPSAHAGASLAATDYKRAKVHYMGVSGRSVNRADPGGHITTTEYDRFGNTVRELSAPNRSLALGITSADDTLQADLGIAGLPSPERATLLSSTSVYSDDGSRLLETLDPLRKIDLAADLKNGSTVLVPARTSVTARPWTVNEYDGGRPTDGSATIKGSVTKTVSGAQVREHPTVQGETMTVETVYDWAKGVPTRSIKDPGGLALTTATEYDADARIIRQIQPGGTATSASTRVTTYWSGTGTGACKGRPEWAGLLCSTGPGGPITGGGTNPSELPLTTTEYDWWGNPAKVTETANGVTRTTTTTYDDAGRPTKVEITGGTGQAVPSTTIEYDSVTGRHAKTTTSSGTISKAYDKLGRQTSYTDADGGTTTTEYDLLDRPTKTTDNAPSTTTYTYDHTLEPRGLPTKSTDSVAGTFQAEYNAAGVLTTERLPGGYTLDIAHDPAGAATQRTYTRDSDGIQVYADTVTKMAQGQTSSHVGWSDQKFRYDKTGRLTEVEDTADTVCTRRTYGFDSRTNRTTKTTAAGTPGADCPTASGTTTNSTYDSGDRLVGTGYAYDAFGRTTTKPGITSIDYYTNDLVRRQTAGNTRQNWELDPQLRFRSWTVESNNAGTWSQTDAKKNHYGDDSDNPRWIEENASASVITRYVQSLSGSMGVSTARSGGVVLSMSGIHGDVALQLPLDSAVAPRAYDSDEYGNARSTTGRADRYGWLGAEQRSTVATSDTLLMGVRLYSPSEGRFLSTDPLFGGNANGYEYCHGDPVNCTDLSGEWSYSTWSAWWSPYRHVKIYTTRSEAGWLAFAAGAVGQFAGIIENQLPGKFKLAIKILRYYTWYIAAVAGYAWKRGKGVVIYTYMSTFPYPHAGIPTVWPRGGW
ncbi:DNRLRE domain-containing protein [Streptomyces sp. NPDC057301]|uniref:DNRLRE domain-containing protein n=1 Tax=Streptomyces sp. NPDC057301 TaxID=3346093 RepID=UPI0036346843